MKKWKQQTNQQTKCYSLKFTGNTSKALETDGIGTVSKVYFTEHCISF